MTCDLRKDNLMVRVGGGYEKFIEYVPKYHRYFERSLVVHMIKSGESLEGVVDAIFNGKKLRNLIKETQDLDVNNDRYQYDSSNNRRRPLSRSRSRSKSGNRRFSFRDVDPYSKTKTLNI